jgi:hypothetical protein
MSHTDSKPKGPEAIAVDLVFPGFNHVYGIPERATSLSLRPTNGALFWARSRAAAALPTAACRRADAAAAIDCVRDMSLLQSAAAAAEGT